MQPFLPAVVDFPTPPFPDATNTICFTPGIGHFRGILPYRLEIFIMSLIPYLNTCLVRYK